jgi:hypothetical protein
VTRLAAFAVVLVDKMNLERRHNWYLAAVVVGQFSRRHVAFTRIADADKNRISVDKLARQTFPMLQSARWSCSTSS